MSELPVEEEITAGLLLRATREGDVTNWRQSDKGYYNGDMGAVEVTLYSAGGYTCAFFKRGGRTTVLEAPKRSDDGGALRSVVDQAKRQIREQSRGGVE